jgi:hypothetical protein
MQCFTRDEESPNSPAGKYRPWSPGLKPVDVTVTCALQKLSQAEINNLHLWVTALAFKIAAASRRQTGLEDSSGCASHGWPRLVQTSRLSKPDHPRVAIRKSGAESVPLLPRQQEPLHSLAVEHLTRIKIAL